MVQLPVTSQPFVRLLSQSRQPLSQATPHVALPPVEAQRETVRGPVGVGHAAPHMPQCAGVERLASQPFDGSPSQLPKPALQVPIAHVPAEHTGEAFASVQTRPHMPQFAMPVRTSTSQPSAALPLQLPKPGVHAATVHAPRAHPAVAFGRAHDRPHMPQWAGVVLVSVSQPFAALPSQSPKPEVQVYLHVPASQLAVLFARDAPGVPHAPQAVTLVRRSVSQPFAASPSQFAKGAVQLPTPQTPLRQTGVAFGATQRVPQPPQFSVLDCVSAQPARQHP